MIATLRACLENRIRKQIPVAHGSFAWLVEHAAWLHTIKKKQSDGITAYQRLRGRSFGPKLLGFGERCLFMLQRKSQDRSLEGKFGSKWREGNVYIAAKRAAIYTFKLCRAFLDGLAAEI